MLEREGILAEIDYRMSLVTGIVFTARNPKTEPGTNDLPAVLIYELDDKVLTRSSRGGYPIYRRQLNLVLETFIVGSSETASSKEVGAFAQILKRELYRGDAVLGKRCKDMYEVESTRMLRPPVGANVAGIGFGLELIYTENIASLYT